jgi:uncharacterized protein (DUF488 family)
MVILYYMAINIYTIGHSNHPIERFLALLRQHAITAIADVRSVPYSRRNPQFNSKPLTASLDTCGISYVSLGKELGARSGDPACYDKDGRVQYRLLAQTPLFNQGIERVLTGAQRYRIALVCAEKEPLDCHRTLLVSRALETRGATITHILAGGLLESNLAAMSRLVKKAGLEKGDLFSNEAELIDAACTLREQKIAYVKD